MTEERLKNIWFIVVLLAAVLLVAGLISMRAGYMHLYTGLKPGAIIMAIAMLILAVDITMRIACLAGKKPEE